MDNIISLEELLNITKTIEKISEKNEEENELLTDRVCKQYDIVKIRKSLLKLFTDFRTARYLYDFPSFIRTTTVYEKNESNHQRKNVSQVENAITKYIDKQILTTNIYYSILKLTNKLVDDEVIYMINTFLQRKTEDDIAEILGISKTYLQVIKKSCLVKMWTDLEKYCPDE